MKKQNKEIIAILNKVLKSKRSSLSQQNRELIIIAREKIKKQKTKKGILVWLSKLGLLLSGFLDKDDFI